MEPAGVRGSSVSLSVLRQEQKHLQRGDEFHLCSPVLLDWLTHQHQLFCRRECLSGVQPLWLSECVSVAVTKGQLHLVSVFLLCSVFTAVDIV